MTTVLESIKTEVEGLTFEEAMKLFITVRDSDVKADSLVKHCVMVIHPLIPRAYELLGENGIEAVDYDEATIAEMVDELTK